MMMAENVVWDELCMFRFLVLSVTPLRRAFKNENLTFFKLILKSGLAVYPNLNVDELLMCISNAHITKTLI